MEAIAASTFYHADPRFSLSSSTSSSHLPFSTFLGRDGRVRVHAVRSRRMCRRLGLLRRRTATRCVLGDGGVSADVVLAAAAAVAAVVGIGAFYLESGRSSGREQGSEFSDPETPDILENAQLQDSGFKIEKDVWGWQTLGLECSDSVTLSKEGNERVLSSSERSIYEKGNASDVKGSPSLEFRGDVLMYDGISVSKVPQEAILDSFASTPSENVETGTTGGSALAFLAELVASANTIEPESTQNTLTSEKEGASVVFPGSGITAQNSSSGSSIILNDSLSQVITDNQRVNETAIEVESLISRSDEHLEQAVGEASSSCKEGLAFDLGLLSQISQQFTLKDSYGVGSQKIPTNGSFLAAESSAGRQKKITSSKNLTKGKEKRLTQETKSRERSRYQKPSGMLVGGNADLMHQNKSRKRPRYPQPDEIPVKNATDPFLSLSSYNHLLRDGRLKECIELLETMDRKGLLDMNKVYHTRFLKNCKTHKAVKEAFSFTKLIKNPTLSTFNMLLSVCASSQDYEGALQVLLLVKEAGLRPDCQLYTTLISTCAKSGKVDAMFEVFHEMVNAGAEPTVHTYSALIDGCARAQQVAKAFGAYGIMRSKNVKPDRVIFNSLITACGKSGAVDRAFDVLAEMMAEPQPIDPDHVTVGALMKTCTQAGQADRAREVYKMLHQYKIKGTQDVYTIGVHSCSLTGDLEFGLIIYDDMKQNGIDPDEMFLSTLMDVAGHARKVEIGFDILQEARTRRIQLGSMSYSSLMGACSNAKNWRKALELHEEIKAIKLCPTVSTLNALVTSLCDGDQLLKAVEVLGEMKEAGVHPNTVTYSILFVACEKQGETELAFHLLSQAEEDGVPPNLIMCGCLTGLCLQSFEKAHSLGEPLLSNSAKPQIDNKWTTWALMAYRKTISAGVVPSTEAFSQVLGCLKFPNDTSLRNRFVENLGLGLDATKHSNIYSLLDGFGEYDPRSFSIFEEASSVGVVPCVSFKDSPIVVDARKLQIHTTQVYLLTILKCLKHRLAAGARLPNLTIMLPTGRTQILSSAGERTINVSGRVGQAVGAMLRRLELPYQGDMSYGKIRINGLALRRWFKPKITFPALGGKPADLTSSHTRLAKEIINQQRNIRSSYSLSIEY